MAYYADPRTDLPAAWRAKRVIFYALGLKVYGQIPYVLQRRLQAQFRSNSFSFLAGRLTLPTGERNYTVVPYRRDDGERQPEAALDAFLAWLEADAGYEWAVAAEPDFNRRDLLEASNVLNHPPATWIPDMPQGAATLRRLLEKTP